MRLVEKGLRPTNHCACCCARFPASRSPRSCAAADNAFDCDNRTLALPRKSNHTGKSSQDKHRRRGEHRAALARRRNRGRPRAGASSPSPARVARPRFAGRPRPPAHRRDHSPGTQASDSTASAAPSPSTTSSSSRDRGVLRTAGPGQRPAPAPVRYETGGRGSRASGRCRNSRSEGWTTAARRAPVTQGPGRRAGRPPPRSACLPSPGTARRTRPRRRRCARVRPARRRQRPAVARSSGPRLRTASRPWRSRGSGWRAPDRCPSGLVRREPPRRRHGSSTPDR